MIINNPQDLTPWLDAMKADVNSSLEALKLNIKESNASTNERLEALAVKSVINNIYRIEASADGIISIPSVCMDKTVINVLSSPFATSMQSGGSTSRIYKNYGGGVIEAKLISNTEVSVKATVKAAKVHAGTAHPTVYSGISLEVIEYA